MEDARNTAENVGADLSARALWQWALMLFQRPKAMFAGLAKTGGYTAPLLYALCWSAVASLVNFIVTLVRQPPFPIPPAAQAALLVFGPLAQVAMGFVLTAIIFVIWHLMGSKENYKTAFRCWALLTPLTVITSALGFIHLVAPLVFLYALWLMVVATVEAHGLAPKKAWIVWGSIAGVVLSFMLMAALMGPGISQAALPEARQAREARDRKALSDILNKMTVGAAEPAEKAPAPKGK